MTIGYRETTEEVERRLDERDSLVAAVPAIAVLFGMGFFEELISAQLELTRSGFRWLTFAAVAFVMIAVMRFLRNRRAND